MGRALRGRRYLPDGEGEWLKKFVAEELFYLDYTETCAWYSQHVSKLTLNEQAFLGCNDRYYLFTGLLHRVDGLHPWLFDRCREVERDPDGYIDLWSRFHYKSSLITYSGAIQEIVCDPEITICIFSVVKPIAQAFLSQIKEEFEQNENLRTVYRDVLYANPRTRGADGRPAKWSLARGITVKRKSNPKEATIEAHGLIDGQPTSRHYRLHIYDDPVTQDYLSEALIKKTIERWEMADNLGSHLGARKWMPCTRYHYADLGGVVIERKSLKPRIYPATHNGRLDGRPVFLSQERWEQIKNDQRSTVSAQMLQNPLAGTEATFNLTYLRGYEVIPEVLNVYIMVDPSKGKGERSDRTAIAVVGIDPTGNKYLLDGVRHRMKLSERWSLIKSFRTKWLTSKDFTVQMVAIGYEQYGMLSDLEVIEDMMERERDWFEIKELNTPATGGHSKADRISRLEPDIREGRFYLPAVIYNRDAWPPDQDGKRGGSGNCFWRVWTEEQEKNLAAQGVKSEWHIGQVVYWPATGPTKLQQQVRQGRAVTALRRRDETGAIYDLTRAFIDEARQHPFGTHDDLIDVASRIYDMEPTAPVPYERYSTEPLGLEAEEIAQARQQEGEG